MQILQIYQGERTFQNLKKLNIFETNILQQELIILIFINLVTLSARSIFC